MNSHSFKKARNSKRWTCTFILWHIYNKELKLLHLYIKENNAYCD